jgi:sigma-B regulation protein RsbU (phosphoserine phosphatase)
MSVENSGADGALIREQLSALDTISDLLTVSDFDLDRLLNEICRITAQTLQVKACAIRLLDETTGEMALKAAYGLSPQYLNKGPVIAEKSAFREVIESGEITEIYDVSQESRLQYSREAIAEGICSQLVVGLIRDGRAIGALSVFTDYPHHFTPEEIQTFRTIANQAAVAVYLTQLHQEHIQMQRIEQELAIAAQIQARLMPLQPPDLEGIDIAAWNRSCGEVGGDFYDFIDLPHGNLGIAVGDVSGKGFPAAILMATARTALRVQAENIYAMREIMRRVNRALCRDTRAEQFVTLFYAVLNIQGKVLTYVNAGHNYPLLFRGDQVILLSVGGAPVGVFDDATYEEEVIKLLPGDLLVLYTDGFTDVLNDEDVIFGEERLRQAIVRNRDLSADEIVHKLEAAIAEFTGRPNGDDDDRTMVALKVEK